MQNEPTKDTPTPPSTPNDWVCQWIELSRLLLSTEDGERIQALLAEREPLVAALLQADVTQINPALWAELQLLESQLGPHFEALQQINHQFLQQANQGKKALASYRFPQVEQIYGVESDG